MFEKIVSQSFEPFFSKKLKTNSCLFDQNRSLFLKSFLDHKALQSKRESKSPEFKLFWSHKARHRNNSYTAVVS